MMSGYSPLRHRSCIDLMLPKEVSSCNVDSLRTIGILDSEFNYCNGMIGRKASKVGGTLNTIATEQLARPGREAVDQIITKRCEIDHVQSMRSSIVLTSLDLASCYDRIIHTAAALALLKIGIPHSRIHSMFSSIQKMIHRIRTAFGDSEKTYGGEDLGDWKNFPQGVLQDNASGPGIWTALSSVIFDVLHKRGFT